MTPTNLGSLRRGGPNGPPSYRLLTTEAVGPDDDRLIVTKWARLPHGSSRRFQIRDVAGSLLFDTDDCHDSGNALHAAMMWLGERQKQYDASHAAAPDPALDFDTDAMHGPKDKTEAEVLDALSASLSVNYEGLPSEVKEESRGYLGVPKDAADPIADACDAYRAKVEAEHADPLEEAALEDEEDEGLRRCCPSYRGGLHHLGCPQADKAAPMSPEEQEKALAHPDATFEADRQKVISEVMGMVADPLAAAPCPVCGQPNTPIHQEFEAAMSSAARAVADL